MSPSRSKAYVEAREPIIFTDPEARAALVIAHPGHELRVHHWIERTRPVVFVMTDGSGHTGLSRLASTTAVLERAGATPGSIYGRLSDREVYRAILDGDVDLFAGLADELAAALDRAEIGLVAGDAVEGFNPGHDVCRLVINAALLRLAERGRHPASFEFALEGAPDDCPPEDRADAIRLELDGDALQRKLAAAAGYPEMAYEMERALASHGRASFGVECLRPVRYGLETGGRHTQPPYYESYGEKQVAAGIYREVIRFRDHMAPLAEALGRRAARGGLIACASS
ncbi:MAG: hypothetical protein ACJ76Y_07910 [Thermoanaerobaculia bacterium]